MLYEYIPRLVRRLLSPRLVEAMNQRLMARYIPFMIDEISVEPPCLRASGWALSRTPDRGRFLVGGQPADRVTYPLHSEDLAPLFWALPEAHQARFEFEHSAVDFARSRLVSLEFQPQGIPTVETECSRWFVRDPRLEPPVPGDSNIARVIGDSTLSKYLLGGSSVFGRFDEILRRLGAPSGFREFPRILDWGCGAGRLTRYLLAEAGGQQEVWGADVDSVNVDWCEAAFPGASFKRLELHPPSPFPDGFFDLVVGVSVFTHLRERVAEAWLEELRRITRPGSLLLLTVQSEALMALASAPRGLASRLYRDGLVLTGDNSQLAIRDGDETYYVDVFHSHEYIRTRWGRFFDVVDIKVGAGLHQDLVILRRA